MSATSNTRTRKWLVAFSLLLVPLVTVSAIYHPSSLGGKSSNNNDYRYYHSKLPSSAFTRRKGRSESSILQKNKKVLCDIRGGADYIRGGADVAAKRPTKRSTSTAAPRQQQQEQLQQPILFTAQVPQQPAQQQQEEGNVAALAPPSSLEEKSRVEGGKATIATSVFNLANNVAGAGILTLAAGKATGTGWIPSIVICVALAFASSHTFTLIGKSCEITGQSSFKDLWGVAFGKNSAFVVDSMVFLQCFCVSIIYTGLLGDVFSALLSPIQHKLPGVIPSSLVSRTGIIVMSAIGLLFPLNMIKDLSSLGFTSILGLCAVLYTVFFMVYRSLDGSYSLGNHGGGVGKFLVDGMIGAAPSFEKSSLWNFDLNSLVLVSNLGLAFIAHYNGPSYWSSLANATSGRFRNVSLKAYTILATIYTVTMCAGYATFGDNCRGNILLNYHPKDVLSTLGRIATGISIIFGFPLISNGCRTGFKNTTAALGVLLGASDEKNHGALVSAMLLVTTTLAILLKDIKLVAGLTGAIMGSSLVYICPTLIYTRIVKLYSGEHSVQYQRAKRNLLFIPFGVFVALMGVTMTIKNTVASK